ncbi:hypothetical protein ACU20_05140 [Actinobaculum suis]|nr:hypothetical protein ACU20_05140 [Actinobaculum suis]
MSAAARSQISRAAYDRSMLSALAFAPLLVAGLARASGEETPPPTPDPALPDPSSSPSPANLEEAAANAVENTVELGQVVGMILLGAFAGLVVAVITVAVLAGVVRRNRALVATVRGIRVPTFALLSFLGAWLALRVYGQGLSPAELPGYYDGLLHILQILLILSMGWLAVGAVNGFSRGYLELVKEMAETRYRRTQTQLQILRRLVNVIIVVIAVSAALLTFPTARAVGASLLASAGLISVVAGIAAQSALGNVFAGLQLAFSDSLRVNDYIVWKNTNATVEEITLTYVVLKVWNGRRLIVPSSEMTTTTFENWTRRVPEMTGTVEFDLDWRVPIADLRAELDAILESTDLWNGETGVLQVKSVDNGIVRVAMQVSADSVGEMFDLQFYVREQMLRWLQDYSPESMPRQRISVVSPRELPAGTGEAETETETEPGVMRATTRRPHVYDLSTDKESDLADAEEAGTDADAGEGSSASVTDSGEEVLDASWHRKIWKLRGDTLDDATAADPATMDIGLGSDMEDTEQRQRLRQANRNRARQARERRRQRGKKAKPAGKQSDLARRQGTTRQAEPRRSFTRSTTTAETRIMRPAEIMAAAPKRIPIAERQMPKAYAPGEKPVTGAREPVKPGHEASLFTGSARNESRGRELTGPGPAVLAERERAAARANATAATAPDAGSTIAEPQVAQSANKPEKNNPEKSNSQKSNSEKDNSQKSNSEKNKPEEAKNSKSATANHKKDKKESKNGANSQKDAPAN